MSGSGIAAAAEREHEERRYLGRGVGEDVEDELADVVVDAPPAFDRRDDRGEVVVGEDHGRRLAGDIGARCPIATPMSARRRAGASLTPSPVIATTCPSSRSDVGDAELGLGRAAGEDQLVARRAGASRARSSVIGSSSLADRRPRSRPSPIPTRLRDRRRGEAVVPGDDDDPDAGPVAARDRVRRPRVGADRASRPGRGSVRSVSASLARSGTAVRRAVRAGRRRAPAAPGSRSRRRSTEPGRARSRPVARASPSAAIELHRGSTASGAPFVCTQSPPPALVDRRHQLERGVEVEEGAAGRAHAAAASSVDAEMRGGLEDRDLGRVADVAPASAASRCGVVARDHRRRPAPEAAARSPPPLALRLSVLEARACPTRSRSTWPSSGSRSASRFCRCRSRWSSRASRRRSAA